MDFSQIVGHGSIIEHLRSSVKNNRINHAYIFDGIKGIGKKSLAGAFAKTLNCREGGTEPCGRCLSCKTFEEGNNPDIIYVTHEKRDITVSDVREQIIKNISLKPYSNRYKIFIIPDADKMNTLAQNAFLKTLEEPPGYGIFILLCENSNKLLVTILSRCILFRLHPLPYSLVSEYLMKRGADKAQAQLCSIYSQGSIGMAVELMHSEEFKDIREKAVDTALRLEDGDMTVLYSLVDELREQRSALDRILEIMYLIYRDALILRQTGSTERIIQKDKTDETARIAEKADASRLIDRCEAIEDTRNRLSRNGNAQLLLETLFFRIKER